MTNIETIEYLLPAFWASALINGESIGNPDAAVHFQEFQQYMLEQYGQCWCIDCSSEGFSTSFHAVSRMLAYDCLVFTFDITPREQTT